MTYKTQEGFVIFNKSKIKVDKCSSLHQWVTEILTYDPEISKILLLRLLITNKYTQLSVVKFMFKSSWNRHY